MFESFNLEPDLESFDAIHEDIIKGITFKGTNLWVLAFAIIVASVGLNVNSTAVIIGAMLISPLMGPINGIGYSIATYNFMIFRISLKNLLFAVVVSLIASVTYFAISPVSSSHSELFARTNPTIYDVLIALFGGLAGIVAISSKNKGNILPGVAIATALMPPLCTAGYGLATGQFDYFFGAFYLFTINAIFIATASVLISRILKFPIRSSVDEKTRKKIRAIITIVISIVLLPSIYFGYILIRQEKYTQSANHYILSISSYEGKYLLKHEIDAKEKKITLIYGGSPLTENQKTSIAERIEDFELKGTQVIINQGLTFSLTEEKNNEMSRISEQLNIMDQELDRKQSSLDSITGKQMIGKTILSEISVIYPQLTSCSYSETYEYTANSKDSLKTCIITFSALKAIPLNDKKKIQTWLSKRLESDAIKVFYE